MEKKHYGAIDGLRAIAAIGIVMMHMGANNNYEIGGYIYNKIIPSFTNFVFLFMVISAFGMCCGYYEKILKNEITLEKFYVKRFKKILPFFALLVFADLIMSPSIESLYEAFADLTLMFGFLPNAGNISVIGVGWFLGLIFVFYICFPFYCVLIQNKKRAWIAFIISVLYNLIGTNYFDIGRKNILFSACFFIAGGLIYLYRDEILKIKNWLILGVACIAIVAYYLLNQCIFMCLLVPSVLLMYAIISDTKFLNNKITKFISGISMEIYLCHMMIFRVLEKLKITNIFGNGWTQYFVTVILTLIGAIVFAIVVKKVFEEIDRRKKFKAYGMIKIS